MPYCQKCCNKLYKHPKVKLWKCKRHGLVARNMVQRWALTTLDWEDLITYAGKLEEARKAVGEGAQRDRLTAKQGLQIRE